MSARASGGGGALSGTSRDVVIIVEMGERGVRVGKAGDAAPQFCLPLTLNPQDSASPLPHVMLVLTELFNTIFLTRLHVRPRQCKVLVVESLFWTKQFRDVLLTVLLRVFKVSAVSFQPDVCLAALACGTEFGIVVSLNAAETIALAFAHDRVLVNTLTCSKGGLDAVCGEVAQALGADWSASEALAGANHLGRQVTQAPDATQLLQPAQSGLPRGACLATAQLQSIWDRFLDCDACPARLLDGVDLSLCEVVASVRKLCPVDIRSRVAEAIAVIAPAALPAAWVERRIGGRVCVSEQLVFLGASVFASLPVSTTKFLTLDEVAASETSAPPATPAQGALMGDSLGLLVAPDWLSTQPGHWRFFGPAVGEG